MFGPTFAMEEGQIRRWQTVVQNVRSAREELPEGMRLWAEEVDKWEPDVVITDFEPVSAGFARRRRTPLIAVDNINAIDRCRHGRRIIGAEREDYLIARARGQGDGPGRGRVRRHDLLPAAAGAQAHHPGAADPPARDRHGAERGRRAPPRLLGRR